MKFDRIRLYIIFMAGNLFSIGLTLCKQHSMGLEKYLEFVEKNLVNFPYYFGAVIILSASIIFIPCVAYDS